MNQFEKIKELIKRDKLNSKNRVHKNVYKRAYLMNELRSSGMSLTEIGKMFNRDHATVIHNLRTHEWMTSTNDKLYLEYTEEYRWLLEKVDRESARDLITDIMKCQSHQALKVIKSRITRGVYVTI